ncbi:hypothetical protein [Roseisolibacter sp. H3M3-2]|uniref:hypothetical protein n=1 Tax=Roseisolibacter sp. H3M3-2 TaxID=3031323 RepID=UPI0023DA95CA|nr:hypothetical protein [Roseisolibacter sp. H3M3-2]MDF1503326.1 hypothetical protein [Roseisolibacter sp. H3M3-2]
MRSVPSARAAAPLVAAAASLALAPAAGAQSGDGFLFRAPSGSLTLRAGVDRAAGGGDVFDFVRDNLTFGSRALTGTSLGAEIGVALGSRVDLVVGGAHLRARSRTNYRDFTDADDREIEQTNTFTRVPVTGTLRAYLAPRGRSVGRLAWVPARLAPYVGAGGGAMWYRFEQAGDFIDVDSPDLAVVGGTARSSGWAPTAHGAAGLDVSLSPRVALNTEARYNWARATPVGDFSALDRIDLSGLGVTAGLSFRF